MNPDIALPQLSVLGSKMAYRQMGRSDAPVALFLHGNPKAWWELDLVMYRGGPHAQICLRVNCLFVAIPQ